MPGRRGIGNVRPWHEFERYQQPVTRGAVAQPREMLCDDRHSRQCSPRTRAANIDVARTQGVGSRIKERLVSLRSATALAVVPPVLEEFQLGGANPVIVEDSSNFCIAHTAFTARSIVLDSYSDSC